jgi:hypothetical protein
MERIVYQRSKDTSPIVTIVDNFNSDNSDRYRREKLFIETDQKHLTNAL